MTAVAAAPTPLTISVYEARQWLSMTLADGIVRQSHHYRHRGRPCRSRPEFDLNAVELEVTDQDGKGFRTLLGWEQGADLALRVAVAVDRSRGIAMT